MKLSRTACFVAVSFALLRNVFGQSFTNLNFESAHLVPIPGNPYHEVQFSQAFPGWTGTVGGIPMTGALTNTVYLDTAGIAIIDHNWTNSPGLYSGGLIEGNYTAILMSGTFTNTQTGVDTSLSQTGLVPAGTESLQFKAYTVFDSSGSFDVTLGGQTLALDVLGTDANYTLYAADISSFAGDTEPLSFTVFGENPHVNDEYLYLDSIQFSPSPVPEPSMLSLSALGGLFFFRRMKRPDTALDSN
jgi:hypothetical protein